MRKLALLLPLLAVACARVREPDGGAAMPLANAAGLTTGRVRRTPTPTTIRPTPAATAARASPARSSGPVPSCADPIHANLRFMPLRRGTDRGAPRARLGRLVQLQPLHQDRLAGRLLPRRRERTG